MGLVMKGSENCLFCKIVSGEISCKSLYEDEDTLAFYDIHPASSLHFLIVPKIHIESLSFALVSHEPILGKMLRLSGVLASEQGAVDGFRTIINNGQIGGQEIPHLHIHVLSGQTPLGPICIKK